jgi:hypothetical protein
MTSKRFANSRTREQFDFIGFILLSAKGILVTLDSGRLWCSQEIQRSTSFPKGE